MLRALGRFCRWLFTRVVIGQKRCACRDKITPAGLWEYSQKWVDIRYGKSTAKRCEVVYRCKNCGRVVKDAPDAIPDPPTD